MHIIDRKYCCNNKLSSFINLTNTLALQFPSLGVTIHNTSSIYEVDNKTQVVYKNEGQTPKSDIPSNIAPKIVTPENYLHIWDSSATLISQLANVTIFGEILGGIPLAGAYPKMNYKQHRKQNILTC